MHGMCIAKGFYAMDKFDWKIIHALQRNGRLTNQEIGNLIGLSASQCSRRRQVLEQKNIIIGYSARINPNALGIAITTMIHVNLKNHGSNAKHGIHDLIESEDQIIEAYSLSGDADFILKVVAENLDHLSHFISEKLLSCADISHIKSYIVLKKFKEQNGMLLTLK